VRSYSGVVERVSAVEGDRVEVHVGASGTVERGDGRVRGLIAKVCVVLSFFFFSCFFFFLGGEGGFGGTGGKGEWTR